MKKILTLIIALIVLGGCTNAKKVKSTIADEITSFDKVVIERYDDNLVIYKEKGDSNLHYKITINGEIKTGTLTSDKLIEYLVDKVLN
jgi:hypothetical protein